MGRARHSGSICTEEDYKGIKQVFCVLITLLRRAFYQQSLSTNVVVIKLVNCSFDCSRLRLEGVL
jgi:hypothetical protein